jgi:hypothetical protein
MLTLTKVKIRQGTMIETNKEAKQNAFRTHILTTIT